MVPIVTEREGKASRLLTVLWKHKSKKITDVRSWFGLVNQIFHYSQLTEMMHPFKPLLSPKCKFIWTHEMEEAFQKSKFAIVSAIQKGIEIFDPSHRTCLRPTEFTIGKFQWQRQSEHQKITDCACANDGDSQFRRFRLSLQLETSSFGVL